jgi:hypothetical protein
MKVVCHVKHASMLPGALHHIIVRGIERRRIFSGNQKFRIIAVTGGMAIYFKIDTPSAKIPSHATSQQHMGDLPG